LGFGTLIALFLLIAPGAIVGRIAQLTWPIAVAVAAALTYGVVALAIIPFGALGIPWNGWTALAALAAVCLLIAGLQLLFARYRDTGAEAQGIRGWPAITVAAGVLLGVLLVSWAAWRGIVHWQSIPSTWDAVWHANTVRFILDTGQASSTHMGELRNVETHAPLYYPSVFHALAAVFCQLTGAAPTTGYTLTSVAASVWLFPSSAAVLTWFFARPLTTQWRAAGATATAAALSASFTSVPYVEFGVAAMPNLAAYGVAIPTFVLIASTLRHRDRIPVAVLALMGIFSVHLTGGFVVILFLLGWWLLDALRHPVRGRLADTLTLAVVAVPTGLILAPQFLGVLKQADIIAGHAFPSFKSVKQGVIDALFLHTRHLNDFPIQFGLVLLCGIGMAIFLYKKIWWPAALWLVLTVAIIYSGAPFHNTAGAVIEEFSKFFYNDPRRLTAVVTMLLTPMAGIALFAGVTAGMAGVKRLVDRVRPPGWDMPAPVWVAATALVLAVATVFSCRNYLYRHLVLFGDKYDSVIIDHNDLDAMAYLATLPGAKNTLIGDSNVDGTAWMYAVADLHPLWTHYDFPQQTGPGYFRYIFWARANTGNPWVVEAVRVLNIRYILTSEPTVRGFKEPEGIRSLEKSKSWAKIYDNGGAQVWEWRGSGQGGAAATHS
jgi:D-galactosaminyltransferase